MAISLGHDVELVRRARTGDTAAFGVLVGRHQRLVVAVALAVTRERALAEDAAQEAFVTAWRGLAGLREEVRVGPWIAGIARHRALDLVRARTRARGEQGGADVAHPACVGGVYHEPPTTAPSPLEHLVDAEEHELIAGALAALPEPQREAVILHYFEGRSVRAVAAALELSEDAVKQRLHRAREALRDRVADRLGDALECARPTAAFATGVIAAIGLAGTTASAAALGMTGAAGVSTTTQGTASALAGKVILGMTTKQIVIGVGGLLALGGAALVATRGGRSPARASTPAAVAAAPTPTPAAAPTRTPATRARKLATPGDRERLLTAIRAARARREATEARPTPAAALPTAAPTWTSPKGGAKWVADPNAPAPKVDTDAIRDGVREFIPLVTECYEAALGRTPGLSGKLVVRFSIEGEPEIGGVVGESSIDAEESTLIDADFHECVRETMYAAELPPPDDGGVVFVTYPFLFETGDDDDGAAATPPPAR